VIDNAPTHTRTEHRENEFYRFMMGKVRAHLLLSSPSSPGWLLQHSSLDPL
jgi:hypothetical protein